VKVIEFPKQDDQHESIMEFMDQLKELAQQNRVTDAVVVMMNEDGEVGVSVASSYIEAMGLLSIALREL
jgi:wyosine [tRNA(Phe)-imidazoG37] synthetase (radical SAM superfamily)